MNLVPETCDWKAYLTSDAVIDWRHREVQRAAESATLGASSDVHQARALFEWVRDHIPHTRDAGREEVTCSASEVLTAGTGLCYAKAHLLAAMLRSVGIPSGFCYQVFEDPDRAGESKRALHGLNGIYLESLSRWIRVDPRGNAPGVNAQFDIDSETASLAFPELEFLDNRIYANPLPTVVTALRSHLTCSSLWPHLPGPEEPVAGAE